MKGSTHVALRPSDAICAANPAMIDVYMPVVRGCLGALACYYTVIAISHPFFEHGVNLWLLMGVASITAMNSFAWFFMLPRIRMRFWHLEAAALITNGLMLLNVLAYLLIHFEPQKLVYFILMSLVFAVSSPSRRIAYPSIAAALAALLLLAQEADAATRVQFECMGVAAAFAAFGMSRLIRGAIDRSLAARVVAETLNAKLDGELQLNNELRQRAEDLALRERAANRAKTEFLATITHELRTPLNGVLGMVQVMVTDPLEDIQRQRLETIRGSGQALLQIINDVLDISKIEAGRLELSPTTFDLGRFAGELRDIYMALATERGLAFSLELDAAAEGWRLGDEVRLRQVLSNLLSNALKFTERGGVVARIGGDAERLIVSVSDTGIGISAEQGRGLFGKFVQADASTTRRFGGTGLGLAICREIVQLMGGDISFTSTPGEGSCFTFEAPMKRVAAPASVPAVAVGAADNDRRPTRVLIADDNATNRLVLTTLLDQFDIASEAVNSGRAAIAAWETGVWDAILMDVHMPEMDGLTATTLIRNAERSAQRPRTPIIAVTASVLSHETDAYFQAGMDDYVAKPIEIETLLTVLRRAIADSEPADAPASRSA
jgi:signal transduction histidine kinase/ActR/RegA family two-component response regulator